MSKFCWKLVPGSDTSLPDEYKLGWKSQLLLVPYNKLFSAELELNIQKRIVGVHQNPLSRFRPDPGLRQSSGRKFRPGPELWMLTIYGLSTAQTFSWNVWTLKSIRSIVVVVVKKWKSLSISRALLNSLSGNVSEKLKTRMWFEVKSMSYGTKKTLLMKLKQYSNRCIKI